MEWSTDTKTGYDELEVYMEYGYVFVSSTGRNNVKMAAFSFKSGNHQSLRAVVNWCRVAVFNDRSTEWVPSLFVFVFYYTPIKDLFFYYTPIKDLSRICFLLYPNQGFIKDLFFIIPPPSAKLKGGILGPVSI